MNIYIFEDKRWRNFLPLTYTRAQFDLKCGILKLRQKIESYFPHDIKNLIVRNNLHKLYLERFPNRKVNKIDKGNHLFINGTILITEEIINELKNLSQDTGLFYDNICLGFKKSIKSNMEITTEEMEKIISKVSYRKTKYRPINYIWELVNKNSKEIKKDSKIIIKERKNYLQLNSSYHLTNPEQIFVGYDVHIEPNVLLDATEGPVIIDDKSHLMANVVIKGPVYIGKNSIVKVSAKIYKGTTIGKTCKVGGEIEDSIIHAFSNKQHDGFLGHSYLGEWINIGADTNNSDLKNNYKKVKVYFYPENKYVSTDLQFFGLIMGDHSKTGINTTFNTGCVIGIGCNLFSSELFRGFIPSFSWGKGTKLIEYKLKKMLETADIVKKRRNLNITESEKEILTKSYEDSKKLRKIFNR